MTNWFVSVASESWANTERLAKVIIKMSKVERFEHMEIKMVRGHKLVDEDREFSMSEE